MLRLPYESKLVEFSKGRHRAPEFLVLNPARVEDTPGYERTFPPHRRLP